MTNRDDDTDARPRRHGIITGVAAVLALAVVTALLTNWLSKPSAPPSATAAIGPPPAAVAVVVPPVAAPPSVPPAQAPVVSPIPAAPPQVAVQPPPSVQAPGQSGEQPAWIKFATASVGDGTHPRVAIVIDDLGLDRPRTARAIDLPAPVTLSFLAYSGDLPGQTAAARGKGHELLVHVPMEPVNARQDMGPHGLATNQSRDEVLRRLRWDLDRFDGYVGINNHMGSRFTGDGEAMDWVLSELKSRGLMFMDSRTIAASTGQKVAAAEGVPYVSRDIFLDDDQSAVAVQARLKEVEVLAKRRGTAVAIGHPHDATLDALNAWIATLPQKGIVLVPLTDIVKARMRS
jgi:polysaccharide deacetylase 2 family uncharacterized protein YibQ